MVTGESTSMGVAKLYSTPIQIIPDELLMQARLEELGAVLSLSSHSDNYTQPEGGHLCPWAIKDSPKYPVVHRIPSFHWETSLPGGETEYSCLDFERDMAWGFGDLDTEKDQATSITPRGLQPPFNLDWF